MSGLRLRLATPEDSAAIAALLAASYEHNPKADEAVLRWQYWDNPFGAARSWIAEAGGQIVGHWAAVGVPVRVGGRRVRAAKGVDIATHPGHRRRGVFTQVARALVADCRERGTDVLLTHPNPESAVAVHRAGAALVGRAAAYVRPLSTDWLAGRLHLPPPLAAAVRRVAFRRVRGADEVAETPEPPAGVDDLWAALEERAGNGVVRDGAWWRWRYAERPGAAYRFVAATRSGTLTGAAAVVVAERYGARFGLVCELLAADREAARTLAAGLEEVARAQGAVGLAAVALPGSWPSSVVASAALRRLPRRLEPRPLRVMVLVPGGDSAALAAEGWSMAWGDLDHL